MIYVLLVFLILLCIILPKSKFVQLLLVIVIYSIYALSFDGDDFLNYTFMYDSIASGEDSVYEVLFVKLLSFISKSGLPFFWARCIIYFFVVGLLVISVNKLTSFPNPVWACYLIFSAFPDGPLIRNTIAMSIALFAISICAKKQTQKRLFLSFLLLICASLFHSSYWVLIFCAIIMIAFYKGLSVKEYIFVFIIAFFIFTSMSNLVFEVFGEFAIRENVIEKYQTGQYANWVGTCYNILKYILIAIPVFYCTKKKICNSNIHFFIYYLSLSFAVVLIVQNYAVNYSRLFRLLLFIIYTYCSNIIYSSKFNNKILNGFGMVLYSVVFACLFYFFENTDTQDTIWKMHFETNLLFNLL